MRFGARLVHEWGKTAYSFQLILMKDGLFGTMKDAQEGVKLQWYVVDCPKPGFRSYESEREISLITLIQMNVWFLIK